MAAHSHWRINITAGNSTAWVYVGELEMRTSVAGANVCTGGTASASSTTSAGTAASNAFDGSTATYWQSVVAPSMPQWLRYSFAAPVDIVQIVIKAASTSSDYQYSPKDIDLQWSDDGTTWTTLFSAAGMSGWTSGSSYTLSLSTASSARVTAQSLEVLSASAASLRVTAQSLEVLVATYEQRICKAVGYAVLTSASNRIGLQKAMAYAVLDSSTVARVRKAYAYAVLHDPAISTVDRRKPVIAFCS